MICALVESLLDLYVLERLISFETRLVASHLESCDTCAREASAWRQTLHGLKSLSVPTTPTNLKSALKRSLAAAVSPKPSSHSDFAGDWRPLQIPSLALAFGCMAFLISVSASILGPGPASQSCSDSPSSVCITPFASQSAIRRNP